jgi:predicted MFS family arabinose efflux permease
MVGLRPPNSSVTATVFAVAGNLAFQTYLATFLAGLSEVTPALLGGLLAVSGLAGVAGVRLAGALVDRIGAQRALASAAIAVVMAGFAVCWAARPIPLWLTVTLLVAWSATAWAVPPAVQALMLARAGQDHATAAMAITSSTVYLGAAAGGVAGGAMVGAVPGAIPILAAGCAAVTLGISRNSGATFRV